MAKFRKKPVEIEAWQTWIDGELNQPGWLKKALDDEIVKYIGDGAYSIDTMEGTMIARKRDWIIRGVKGELYPCKPDIFEATYEPIESLHATIERVAS